MRLITLTIFSHSPRAVRLSFITSSFFALLATSGKEPANWEISAAVAALSISLFSYEV